MTQPTKSVFIRRTEYYNEFIASGTVTPVLYDNAYDGLSDVDVLDLAIAYDPLLPVAGYVWNGIQHVLVPTPTSPTYHLVFDGIDDSIVIPASASLSNLPLGDFTVDFVARLNLAEYSEHMLRISKLDYFESVAYAGWLVGILNTNREGYDYAVIEIDNNSNDYFYFDVPSNYSWEGIANLLEFHHIEIVYFADPPAGKIFIDGVMLPLGWQQGFETNGYTRDDSTIDLVIGERQVPGLDTESFSGGLRWLRISNTARHSSDFTPSSLTVCPDTDANTVLLLPFDDGEGSIAHDTSGHGNDGTTDATWVSNGIEFNGINNRLDLPASFKIKNVLENNFTLDLRASFPIADASTTVELFGSCTNDYYDGWYVDLSNFDGTSYLVVAGYAPEEVGTSIYLSFPLPLDFYNSELKHIEVSVDLDNTTAKCFVDGVEIEQDDYVEWNFTPVSFSTSHAVSIMCNVLGYGSDEFSGTLHWWRLSNTIRHTSSFTPPTVCPEDDDFTTIRLALDEGTGTTIKDSSGNDGVITGATWQAD
jgi:hypothetical protein